MPATLTKAEPMERGNGEIRLFREADSQTIRFDDFVKLTTGRVAAIATLGTDADFNNTVPILGLAQATGRNRVNAGQPITGEVTNLQAPILDFPVYTTDDDTFEVLLPLWISTGGANATRAAITPGFQCVLSFRSNIWCANIGNTTNPNLIAVEPYEGQADVEQYGWWWFRVPVTAPARAIP